MIYLELFIAFLKVGLFSFGGGYASIPLIHDVVSSYGWLGDNALADMIAVSESTPGPVMVNIATYVGNRQGGILGASVATFAVVLPAFLIIILLTALLGRVLDNRFVKAVLGGMKSCVAGIIAATGVYMISSNLFPSGFGNGIDTKALILTLILAVVYFGSRKVTKKGISPILLIVLSAACGVVAYGA